MIDFEALKKMDIEVVNEPWTTEEQAAFSKFLAERRKKEAKKQAQLDPKKRKKSANAKSR